MSWFRHRWRKWHLEDQWSARAPHAGQVQAACGEKMSTIDAYFERAESAKVPRHERCSECQSAAMRHGEG